MKTTSNDKMEYLVQAVEVARNFKPMEPSEVAELLARTKDPAAKGEFEPFKITANFDGTAHNPDWLK